MRKKRLTDQFQVTYCHFIGGAEEEHGKIAIRLPCVATEIRNLHLQNKS